MEMITSCGSASRTRSYFAKLAVMLSRRKDDSACWNHRDGSTVQKGQGRPRAAHRLAVRGEGAIRDHGSHERLSSVIARPLVGNLGGGVRSAPSIHYSTADLAKKILCRLCVRQEVTNIEEQEMNATRPRDRLCISQLGVQCTCYFTLHAIHT